MAFPELGSAMEVSLRKACGTRHSAGLLPPTRPLLRPHLPPGVLLVTVVTPRKGRYALEVKEDFTKEELQKQLIEAKTFANHTTEPMLPKSRDNVELRMVYKGIPIKKQTLKELGVANGATLLALPAT